MADINQLLDRKRTFAGTGARRSMPVLPFIPQQNLNDVSHAAAQAGAERLPTW